MIVLWLLAAHMVGDFVLQTRWQATGKSTDRSLRMRHVWAYGTPFVPIVCWRCWGGGTWHEQRGVLFIALLVLLHFATDSRRFVSTLGDWIVWRVTGAGEAHDVGERYGVEVEGAPRLLPNPWGPLPILIDQSLHLVQLAVLGSIFLR